MMMKNIHELLRREDGAVTVDWVVLTASIVALGAIVGAVIWNNTGNAATQVATFVGSQQLNTTF